MDRSSLRKRNIGSKPAAEAVARSGSVAANKDNLIQAKTQQSQISQSPPSQLLAINGNSNNLLNGANTASIDSVEVMRRSTQLKQSNGFSVLQRAGGEEASEAAAAEEPKSVKSFGDEKTGKIKKPEASFDKFELAMTGSGAVSKVTNLINMAATGGREEGDKSTDTDSVSALVTGMIGAVQTAYREARKVYSVFQEAKRLEAAGKDSGEAQKAQTTVLAMANGESNTLCCCHMAEEA